MLADRSWSTDEANDTRSPDDGNSWGNRRNIYTATGENNNAGAPQVINVGGTLVVSFMTDEDTQVSQALPDTHLGALLKGHTAA